MTTVGYATLQIIPSAKGFRTSLERETTGPMRSVGAAGGSRFRDGFLSRVKGMAGPLLGTFGVAAIAGFAKQSIDAASNLSEAINKSNVIFGDSSKVIESWAKDSGKNILLTQQQAIDAASQFALFGKAAGLTGNDLAKFSTDLTGLAQDFSSFFNADTDTAVTAIGAALRGESEPIRQFGVLLTQDLVEAEALRMGLLKSSRDESKVATTKARLLKAQENLNKTNKKANASAGDRAKATAAVTAAEAALKKALEGTTGALTPQQKVLAAQSLIMQQTSDAQGDAARTSGGFANQSRILAQNVDKLKIALGVGLLPVALDIVSAINKDVLPAFQAWMDANGPKITTAIGSAKGALKAFVDFIVPKAQIVKGALLAFFAWKTGLAIGTAVTNAIVFIERLIAVYKTLRSVSVAAAIAEAFATGGVSAVAGAAGAAAAAASMVAAFTLADGAINSAMAGPAAAAPPKKWVAPRPGTLNNAANPNRITNITINNPTPEPAGKSTAKAVQRAAALGLAGLD